MSFPEYSSEETQHHILPGILTACFQHAEIAASDANLPGRFKGEPAPIPINQAPASKEKTQKEELAEKKGTVCLCQA